ncbi:MAG: hypothetical protein ACKO38_20510 [Planctomycetota bacterium]
MEADRARKNSDGISVGVFFSDRDQYDHRVPKTAQLMLDQSAFSASTYKLGAGGAGAEGGFATPAGGSPLGRFPAGAALVGPAVGIGSGLSGIADEESGPPQPTPDTAKSETDNNPKIQFLTITS